MGPMESNSVKIETKYKSLDIFQNVVDKNFVQAKMC